MVDVFISYSRTNKDKVAQLARAIEAEGYNVWWDAELPPHQSYGDVITAKIESAKAAIVVWSPEAAASEWVRAEADVARNQKKLVQTALGDIMPPLPFNQIQYANLGDWNGEPDHPEWRKVKRSLVDLCGPREPPVAEPAHQFPAGSPPAEPPPAPPPPPAPIAAPPPAPAPAQFAATPGAAEGGSQAPGVRMGDRSVPMPVVIGGGVAALIVLAAGWMIVSGGSDDPTDPAVAGGSNPAGDAGTVIEDASGKPTAEEATPQAPPTPVQRNDGYNREVTLINQTGDVIMYLYWSNTNEQYWGEDRLGTEVLGDGLTWRVTVDDGSGACNFDLMAQTAGGRQVERNNVNVCSVSEIYFQ